MQSPATPFLDMKNVEMVHIPAGSFQMGGDPQLEVDACKKYTKSSCILSNWGDQEPIHMVAVDSFDLDVYEVTNKKYRECVTDGVCQPPSEDKSMDRFRTPYYSNVFYDDFPVVYVSWNDAKSYCGWRNARLPTEAEWEYAARGGQNGKLYPWGDDEPVCTPNTVNGANGTCFVNDTSKVGVFGPNNYGLYDMAGNVWEWVEDWYELYPGKDPGERTYWGLGHITHVLRGGSARNHPYELSVSNRLQNPPDNTSDFTGFRCARSAQ